MSQFKKGQKVIARALRGTERVKGVIEEVSEAPNGPWITIRPDDKDGKAFRTRPACVEPA